MPGRGYRAGRLGDGAEHDGVGAERMNEDQLQSRAMTPEQAEMFLLELVKVIEHGFGSVTVTVNKHRVYLVESTISSKMPVPERQLHVT